MLWLLLTVIAIRVQLHAPTVLYRSNDSHLGPNFTRLHTASHCCTLLHSASYCFTQLHTASHITTLTHTASHSFTQLHTASHSSTLLHTAPHCLRQLHTASQLRIASQSFTLPHIACSVSLFLPPSFVSLCLSLSVCLCLSLCVSVSGSLSLSLSLSLLQFKTRFVVSSPTSTRPYPWSSLEPSCISNKKTFLISEILVSNTVRCQISRQR